MTTRVLSHKAPKPNPSSSSSSYKMNYFILYFYFKNNLITKIITLESPFLPSYPIKSSLLFNPTHPLSCLSSTPHYSPNFLCQSKPMWPLRRINTPPPSPRSTPTFSCSSFKDVPSLCSDDVDHPLPPYSPVSSPRTSPTVFQRIRVSAPSTSPLRHSKSLPTTTLSKAARITVYFTSLGVVRKTYEDSLAVRSMLRGYRVPIDERDLSMDSRYVAELHRLVEGRVGASIPCVFVGSRRLGGAEEVRRLHESGELRDILIGGGCYMDP